MSANAVAVSAENQLDRVDGQHLVLPGQAPDGQHIMSVLLKRTYNIAPHKECERASEDNPIIPGDVHFGDPMNSTIRYESDFVPFKIATDVVLNGTCYAHGGRPTQQCHVAFQVGQRRKELIVTGDRSVQFVENGTPVFSEPKPFNTMEMRYERAYGGVDVFTNLETVYPHPNNPLGCGFVLENVKAAVDKLSLPNIEDPAALLTPETLCLGDYANWEKAPPPSGLGWVDKSVWRRGILAGVMPADRELEQTLRMEYAKLVPEEHRDAYVNHTPGDMDFKFFNGASEGLVFPFLEGGEEFVVEHLTPEGLTRFNLTKDKPSISIDIGGGPKTVQVVMQTVMIDMDKRQLDVVWRGATPYEGPDWLPQMQKMEVAVT